MSCKQYHMEFLGGSDLRDGDIMVSLCFQTWLQFNSLGRQVDFKRFRSKGGRGREAEHSLLEKALRGLL